MTLSREKLGARVYGGRLTAQKFAKRLFKKIKPGSEWEGRLYLEEGGRSQYLEPVEFRRHRKPFAA